MNDEAVKVLQNICKKELHELTEYDKGFLRARVSYLTEEQFNKYQTVFAINQDNTLTQVNPSVVYPELVKLKEVSSSGLAEFHELQKQAKALGVDTRGLKKEQLKDAILSKS